MTDFADKLVQDELATLKQLGRDLQNGKSNDLSTMSKAIGMMSQVVVALALTPAPTLTQCERLHADVDKRISSLAAAIQGAGGGNIWIKIGDKFQMGSKSVLACIAIAVIGALTYLGSVYLEATTFSTAAITRAVEAGLPTALEMSLPAVLPKALDPIVAARAEEIRQRLGVEKKDSNR